jgi:hypothetical protein
MVENQTYEGIIILADLAYSFAMTRFIRFIRFLVFVTSALWFLPAGAALEVETGQSAGSCITLVNTLKNRWFDVKHHMQPVSGKISLPKNDDFRCVSRGAVRSALEKRIVTGANIKCYDPIGARGLGVCCDNPLTSCAQLNPALFPELREDRRKKSYEPPKSNWVRPPSDTDQWNSNE